jgi:hypothetical protein
LLVYEQSLWIADGNKLHSVTSTAQVDAVSLTLDPGEEIMALGVDPVTGLMMIGVRNVTTSSPPSTDIPAKNSIYLFDGFSSKARRKIPVQGTPFSFTTVGGVVMVGLDNTIGIWNGSGVSFLRRLSALTSIPTKQLTAVVNNIFFVADGKKVLAYGDVMNGKRVWFPIYTSTTTINSIFQQSRGVLGINSDSSSVKYISIQDTTFGAATGTIATNNINFERPVEIRRMRVYTTGITTTAGIGSVSVTDENNASYTPTQNKFVVASGTKYVFDFDFNYRLQTLQPNITLDTQAFGINKILIYYDVSE